MFDIGFWEILLIGIIALLVIGPERLPSFIRSTADTIKSIKSVANGFKEEVSQQLKTHELHENLKKAEQMGMENIGGDIKKSVDELRAAAESVQQPYKTPSNTISSTSKAPLSGTLASETLASETPASTMQAPAEQGSDLSMHSGTDDGKNQSSVLTDTSTPSSDKDK